MMSDVPVVLQLLIVNYGNLNKLGQSDRTMGSCGFVDFLSGTFIIIFWKTL